MKLSCVLFLISSICLPCIAQALPCTFGSDPPDRNINWDEIDPVSPSAIQNDDFNYHFTITAVPTFSPRNRVTHSISTLYGVL